MNLRQAAQQALEAMEDAMYRADTHEFYDAKESLRCAIEQAEQAEQEPVAWMQEMPISGNEERSVRMTTVKMVADEWDSPIPLYLAAPAPPPECKTEAEKTAFAHGWWKALEAQREALAEPEQEPVAWNWMQDGNPCSPAYYGKPPDADIAQVAASHGKTVRLLYTAPTPRNEPVIDKTMAKRIATQLGWEPPKKPLTDEEIETINRDLPLLHMQAREGSFAVVFARAIERAHGIGDNK